MGLFEVIFSLNNPYKIFARQWVYIVTIISKIVYNLLFITESEAISRTSTVILVFSTRENLLQH